MSQDLWSLVWGQSEIDPSLLASAIEAELEGDDLDFRTRLLIRDGTRALEEYWGAQQLVRWLDGSPVGERIRVIWQEDLGKVGFPFVKDQLMDSTRPDTVKQYLRELGTRVKESTTLQIGGSIALILGGNLIRATSDIDVVDEVPVEIRGRREMLDELGRRYGLILTHFQSHYLPDGWRERCHSIGRYGQMEVEVVDVYDVLVSKLFSRRTRDLDDLRAVVPRLDKATFLCRVQENSGSLASVSGLKECAETNWYILFGESLPWSA